MSGKHIKRTALGAGIAVTTIGLLTMTLAVTCGERMTAPSEAERRGRQAHLHLSLADCEHVYAKEDDSDPWQSESWTTTASSFDLVVTNRGKKAASDVRVLVAVPGGFIGDDKSFGVQLDGVMLDGDAFGESDPALAGFGAGSHGVYAPSGTAAYATHDRREALEPGEAWIIPVEVFAGAWENFEVHFDAGSDLYFSPPSHDVNVRPGESDAPPPPGDDLDRSR